MTEHELIWNLEAELTQENVVDWIISEAHRRLAEDACCPGGLSAKVHSVWMEIGMKVGDEMRKG